MKTIRPIAAILLIVTGVLHVYTYLLSPGEPGMIGIMIFGIIYGITGFLLFTSKQYPVYLGLILPLIGMTLSIIKFGFPELLSMNALFKLLSILVVICCAVLLLAKKKVPEVVV
ncbi:MAG: hypothetical protein WCE64_02405 [Bacteroidales bacterium]